MSSDSYCFYKLFYTKVIQVTFVNYRAHEIEMRKRKLMRHFSKLTKLIYFYGNSLDLFGHIRRAHVFNSGSYRSR